MALIHRWRRLRLAIPLILLCAILMRLVWMQLRSYTILQDARSLIAIESLVRDKESVCRYERSQPSDLRSSFAGTATKELGIRAWLTSPGHVLLARLACHSGTLADRYALRMNQWLLVATVFMATLMARFLTSSWTVSLIVAGMLMSRGVLLADLGRISPDWILTFLVTAWMTSLAHYLRTGALVSLLGAVSTVVVAATFERGMVVLSLVPPLVFLFLFIGRGYLAKPVIQRLRQVNRRIRAIKTKAWEANEASAEGVFGRLAGGVRWALGMEFPVQNSIGSVPSYGRGSLFRTLSVPFLLWIYHRRRWVRITTLWLIAGLGILFLVFWCYNVVIDPQWLILQVLDADIFRFAQLPSFFLGFWSLSALERIDLHMLASFMMIVMCACQSPSAGLSAVMEASWIALTGFILIALASLTLDAIDAQLLERLPFAARRMLWTLAFGPRAFVLWFEPLILTFGVVGVYNLMKVFDTRAAEKS